MQGIGLGVDNISKVWFLLSKSSEAKREKDMKQIKAKDGGHYYEFAYDRSLDRCRERVMRSTERGRAGLDDLFGPLNMLTLRV